MTRFESHARTGVSLAKAPVTCLGIAAIAWGIAGLIAGGNDFNTGQLLFRDSFFGFESNGATNVIWIAGGALLLLAAQGHAAAKAMSLLVAIAFAVVCVAGVIDGDDVFDVAAVDGATNTLFGASAGALLLIALLPRVGRERDAAVAERAPAAPAREPVVVERPVAREPERIGAGGVTRTTESESESGLVHR